MGTARFLRKLVATNLKAGFALRGSFWLQAGFMVANNLIFWTVWVLFFNKFDALNGWRLPEMTALYGLVAAAFGLTQIFAGGLRNMAQVIADGDFDGFLTQPKSVLLHLAGSRSFPAGWGDIVSGIGLLAASGLVSLASTPLAVLLVVASAGFFVAFGIILHALAFWLGAVNSLARQCYEFLIMFSVYPQHIYTGALRVMLYTVLPAALIGYLPVEVLRSFSWGQLGIVVTSSVAYLGLATVVFRRGLRRYESGNRFTLRG
jgi:ABC-2 type transport system permease protein